VFQQKIAVALDSGDELVAVADQRDLAAFEAQFPDGTGQFTQVRFLAWSALLRAKTYTGTWEKFNRHDCVEAADPNPRSVEVLDPTTPAQPGESS
jgi:hypothetical protein